MEEKEPLSKEQRKRLKEIGLVGIRSEADYDKWAKKNNVEKYDAVIVLVFKSLIYIPDVCSAGISLSNIARRWADENLPVYMVTRRRCCIHADRAIIAQIEKIISSK